MTRCNCGHPPSFHHDGTDDCHWPDCTCSIYEPVDEEIRWRDMTPAKSDEHTYTSDRRLQALRHLGAGAALGQNEPEPEPTTQASIVTAGTKDDAIAIVFGRDHMRIHENRVLDRGFGLIPFNRAWRATESDLAAFRESGVPA